MITVEDFLALPVIHGRDQHLLQAVKQRGPGHVLEMGVANGETLRDIAAHVDHIHGFDSFEGLPDIWDLVEAGKATIPKGYFQYPEWRQMRIPLNSDVWVGLFADTIPQWLADHPGPIGFLHVDCDIYQSAHDVLFGLNERIVPGTVIAFDELLYLDQRAIDLPRWVEHEWRAMNEWLTECDREAQPLSRSNTERAAIRVTR